jgi:hypothetical protein
MASAPHPLPKSGVPDQIDSIFAALAQEGVDRLYEYCSKSRDEQSYRQIADEIEDNLAKAEGVLLVRYTIRSPNGAGGTIPEYVGVRVAGTGSNEYSAIAAYRARDRGRNKDEPPSQCTPNNPLGTKPFSQATLSAAPKSQNQGYYGRVAVRVFSVLKNNPSNVAAPDDVVTRPYIEEKFIFLSREAWKKVKAANSPQRCGFFDGAPRPTDSSPGQAASPDLRLP